MQAVNQGKSRKRLIIISMFMPENATLVAIRTKALVMIPTEHND
jgi:hypothetical protein